MKALTVPLCLLLTGPAWAGSDLDSMDSAALMQARPGSEELAAVGRRYNPEAPVPPMCYTRIEGKHNPCYVCHQSYDDVTRPNYMGDGSLQQEYAFSDAALVNHWTNLFVDRSEAVAAIPDDEILAYINKDNYDALPARLQAQDWQGWMPDLADYGAGAAAFDEQGLARDGSWWVAFVYKPQPSTFWPSNGSTDDVLIRLPAPFYTDENGAESPAVYMANLALLEMAFQDFEDTTLPPVDEVAIGADIDGDGMLGMTDTILRRDHFLGAASDQPVLRMLYPEGTEFLHSVRYVGVAEDGAIHVTRRMKELRYMVKSRLYTAPALASLYGNENQEKLDENLPRYVDLGDRGMDTGFGWTLLGFIEDANGDLRPQTDEEQLFCRGCHASVGATLDQTWAFPRKLPGAEGWGYIDLRLMQDVPNRGQARGEIATYLERAGGADEFRSNDEMRARWFDAKGQVNHADMQGRSVYDLITPSAERALAMNKAYRVIVQEQSFLFGRDATIKPPLNVHAEVDSATAPTLPPEFRYKHDIRLDWHRRAE